MSQTIHYASAVPEMFVAVMACLILVIDLYLREERRVLSYQLSVVTLAVAAVLVLVGYDDGSRLAFHGAVVDDALGDIIKFVVCIVSAMVLVFSREYARHRELLRGEYFVLALFAVVGMMVLASANHLLTLYMGLELLSLCLYTMVAMQRDVSAASEASMKYFVLGALASGILLYGMSLLYGLTGSLQLDEVRAAVGTLSSANVPLQLALIFVIVGLAFKLGVVPFHMWLPDVYEGSPTSSTVFIGTAPKLAGFAMFMRLLVGGLEDLVLLWQDMLVVLAVISIALGNVIAIAQQNIKRMLAYSTVSHMGFFLLGILAGTETGYAAAMLYVVVYAFMSLGAFGVILLLSRKGFEADRIDDLKGLNQSHPWFAFLMLLLMFSLAGVPPTAGFYAKLSVIQAVIEVDLVWVAVVAVLFAVVGAFYYLRIVKLMYFDRVEEPIAVVTGTGMRWLLSANALAMIAVMPWMGLVVTLFQQAIRGAGG